MEENQENQASTVEPEIVSDNSQVEAEEKTSTNEGQSNDPSELILGKFKSVEDLTKAYQELEKFQGTQAQELGNLRQNASLLKDISQAWEKEQAIHDAQKDLQEAAKKYNKPEYFQDPTFREIYKEAYLALGKNLDTDRLVNLIDGYVSSRIFAYKQAQSANRETENAISGMNFEKNNKSSIVPPKKRLDEMTPQEVDELLDRIL